MANISTLSLPQMSDLINRSFLYANKTLPQVMRNAPFVVSDVIAHGTGDTRRYAEDIDGDQYGAVRDEGASTRIGRVQYGYEKDLTTYTIAQERTITKHMRDVGKNAQILKNITYLGNVGANTIDLDLAHRFTFATATSYSRTAGGSTTTISTTVGDGLALASAVHTLTGSATTYSNIVAGNPQFSKGALENAEKLFVEETYDNLGIKMFMEADTILTTDDPNTINQVRELLHATADISTSNSGTFNVYSNAYKHVISHRIATTAAGAPDTTKKKYWALIASKSSSFYLSMLNEPTLSSPSMGNNGEDFSTKDWKYSCEADYAIGIVSAKNIKFSTGLGA